MVKEVDGSKEALFNTIRGVVLLNLRGQSIPGSKMCLCVFCVCVCVS
jgi:hypothetical protein